MNNNNNNNNYKPSTTIPGEKVIGKCSICGGAVVVPDVWYESTTIPEARCKACGAIVDDTPDLPVIKMKPRTSWGGFQTFSSPSTQPINPSWTEREFGGLS